MKGDFIRDVLSDKKKRFFNNMVLLPFIDLTTMNYLDVYSFMVD